MQSEGLCRLERLFRAAENGRSSRLNVTSRSRIPPARTRFTLNQLGLVSALVLGKGTDIRQARHWFEKAARRGYAPAQVNLAVIYINGWGTAQNFGAALNWLTAAAKQGAVRAYADLGVLYMNGWGVRLDYAEARNTGAAAKASDFGYSPAWVISTMAALEWFRITPSLHIGITSPPKTATLSARTTSPIFCYVDWALARAIRKPFAGSKGPHNKATPGPASISASYL
jgi:hypothetical protein